jgi:hypothetical protein
MPRLVAEGALQWDDAVGVGISILAGILFFIAIRAYLRTRTARVALFAAAFGVFFLKGLLILATVVFGDENAVLDALDLVADASILLLFFLGMLKG